MRAPAPRRAEAALAPLRAALLVRALADADATLGRARADARSVLADAAARARRVLMDAAEQGRVDGAAAAGARRLRARRTARATVLAARRAVREETRRRVLEGVGALRSAPDYPTLRDGLVALAREVLGPAAEVVEDPAGGVVARVPGRLLDCTLPALAGHAFDRLGPRLEEVWWT